MRATTVTSYSNQGRHIAEQFLFAFVSGRRFPPKENPTLVSNCCSAQLRYDQEIDANGLGRCSRCLAHCRFIDENNFSV